MSCNSPHSRKQCDKDRDEDMNGQRPISSHSIHDPAFELLLHRLDSMASGQSMLMSTIIHEQSRTRPNAEQSRIIQEQSRAMHEVMERLE